MRHLALELVAIAGQSAALAAERESRPNDRRKRAVVELGERRDDDARRHRQPGREHCLAEDRAVFGTADCLDVGSDQLDSVALENTGARQLDGEIERRLAAERGQESIGALAGYHLRDRLGV